MLRRILLKSTRQKKYLILLWLESLKRNLFQSSLNVIWCAGCCCIKNGGKKVNNLNCPLVRENVNCYCDQAKICFISFYLTIFVRVSYISYNGYEIKIFLMWRNDGIMKMNPWNFLYLCFFYFSFRRRVLIKVSILFLPFLDENKTFDTPARMQRWICRMLRMLVLFFLSAWVDALNANQINF